MVTIDAVRAKQAELEKLDAQGLIKWALESFAERVVISSSFQAEEIVIIHMACKVTKKPRIFTLDTGRLNQETYDVMDEVRREFGIEIEVMFPDTKRVEDMVRSKGFNLFYESIDNRKLCCNIRKVEPLKRVLSTCDAWITGLRREQSPTRKDLTKVEFDTTFGNHVKLNPLVDWNKKQVWDYVKSHKLPYNKLYDAGYAQIGCAPCTRAIKEGEDDRAGRWWWEDPRFKECGLHVKVHAPK